MALVSLGKITVAAAGTPVQFTPTKNTNANCVYIQYPFTGNSGPQVYIGALGLVKATLVGVWRVLVKQAAATAAFDQFNPQSNVSAAPFDLSTFYVDADLTNDFILVSYLVL